MNLASVHILFWYRLIISAVEGRSSVVTLRETASGILHSFYKDNVDHNSCTLIAKVHFTASKSVPRVTIPSKEVSALDRINIHKSLMARTLSISLCHIWATRTNTQDLTHYGKPPYCIGPDDQHGREWCRHLLLENTRPNHLFIFFPW